MPAESLRAAGDGFRASTRYADLAKVDAVVVAVPTPLTRNREPDLGPLVAAGTSLAGVLQAGQLVVLESTTYPGTTRERFVPLLEESGLAAGKDFFAAYSPERIDPGRTDDLRESPALKIMRLLRDQGAEVSYHDDYVPEIPELGLRTEWPDDADCTAIVTAHPDLDVERIVRESPLVVDFRGVTRGIEAPNLVRL